MENGVVTESGSLTLGDGGSLYYEVAGEGDTVVLSHAGFLDSGMFDAIWEPLAERYRVLRYDMRGYGRSSEVQGPVCRREDLRQLFKILGVERAHFVGCSMGGEIVLDLALEEPQRALSLTLVGAAPGGYTPEGPPPRYLMEMIGAAQQGDVERTSELQMRIWIDGPQREPDEVDPDLRARALEMNRIPVERNTFMHADMENPCPLTPPAIERLGEIHVPVLVVVGELEDPAILAAADILAAGIADAQKAVIAQSAHVPSYERAEEFVPVLLAFLASAIPHPS